jgi:hypothetical protein
LRVKKIPIPAATGIIHFYKVTWRFSYRKKAKWEDKIKNGLKSGNVRNTRQDVASSAITFQLP